MKHFFLIASLACLASAADAGEVLIKVNTHHSALTRWTAEDFANARPMPLPKVKSLSGATREAPPGHFEKEVWGTEAAEPTLTGDARYALYRTLFDFQPDFQPAARTAAEETPEPAGWDLPMKNRGLFNLDYTSSRLIPSSAVETFPYSAAGKLYLTASDGDRYMCSAAVIAPRLVITAAHCVYPGPLLGWMEDFVFVPAYYLGEAPFGTWEHSAAFVTENWVASPGAPNAEDWALLEMEDQDGNRIAEVTGKLGFVTGRTAQNHLHILGYPKAFDDGEEMHQCMSGTFLYAPSHTVVYGCDMTGGASGGPWIQNFNIKARGQGGGKNKARAAVVAMSSFGLGSGTRILGASTLTGDFKKLRLEACANQPGNC
ncbi:MAG: trypsin-like serine protease [bacterium]|nr:trypsin-like serine protease [bacterium]